MTQEEEKSVFTEEFLNKALATHQAQLDESYNKAIDDCIEVITKNIDLISQL